MHFHKSRGVRRLYKPTPYHPRIHSTPSHTLRHYEPVQVPNTFHHSRHLSHTRNTFSGHSHYGKLPEHRGERKQLLSSPKHVAGDRSASRKTSTVSFSSDNRSCSFSWIFQSYSCITYKKSQRNQC
ncbi:hypothetical protein HanXRQr2_Chr11g0512121 [Helianthus annuus]|uniref:Uncharacterized protein n=1 Tax=Helianthus annuus TaxID=4232 RepID=A0A251TG56_HELAN|nr:uncharacterized protein LOC110887327 [Helianthus annuus]KAF5783806.1 hypothetical protein HanXRQr2_Chr11g0512121 [Helianthus annuus]KAJ0503075.1 hypothetical protein HanHA300_Chr11g0420121 [Helianthus annuus]KAJ0519041.1 hypothetical protein HanHA89_Chr11g0444171 [Helianthus annuus]KAJ0687037.1 hypothetical protein HanLR1_Chr11g0421421 [Helianthus annuus]